MFTTFLLNILDIGVTEHSISPVSHKVCEIYRWRLKSSFCNLGHSFFEDHNTPLSFLYHFLVMSLFFQMFSTPPFFFLAFPFSQLKREKNSYFQIILHSLVLTSPHLLLKQSINKPAINKIKCYLKTISKIDK